MLSKTERNIRARETFEDIKGVYKGLRVGQAVYLACIGCRSARVVGVGRKWIHLAGGRKVTGADVIDWWMG